MMDDTGKSQKATDIKSLMLQTLFSTAGLSALLYVCGMIAVRSKLNMLGVWTGVDLDVYDYFNESVRIFLSLPVIFGCLIAVALLLILLDYVAGLAGYEFTWSSRRPVALGYGMAIAFLCLTTTCFFVQPMSNSDLLFVNSAKTNAFLPLVVTHRKATWLLFFSQLLVTAILFMLVYRLWSSSSSRKKFLYGFCRMAVTAFFLINCFLIPINYGVMISSQKYSMATIFLNEKDEVIPDSVQGFLLLQTDRELVLYQDKGRETGACLLIINRADISRIQITEASKPLLEDIWQGQIRTEGEMKKTMYAFFAVLLLFVLTSSVAFAEKKSTHEDASLKQEKTTPQADMDKSMFLQFFPAIADYLSACGDDIVAILNSFQNIVKGEERNSGVEERSDLNIWTYNPEQGSYRQITRDGGYFSPRISQDGAYISFIKDSKLCQMRMDGKGQNIVDQTRPYDRLIGWDGHSRYLLADKDGNLLSLDTGEGSLQKIKLGEGDFRNISMDALIEIAETAPGGKTIRACRKADNSWRIIEDCKDCINARIVIDDGFRNLSPSWLNNGKGIIFVSNRQK